MIRELSLDEFTNFAKKNILGNFHQTFNYALLKAEEGYDYELIGFFEANTLMGASLVLTKKIHGFKYGYAPRGFLLDYSNKYILKEFTYAIKSYYKKKNYIFIKINPEIAIGEYNYKNKVIVYNSNKIIIDNLINCGYKKLKNNENFESILPRMNPIIQTKNFNLKNINKNTRNKINKGITKGLYLEKGNIKDIDNFYNLVKNKRNKDKIYYNYIYNIFNKQNNIDLFLIKIDYKKYLINSQKIYHDELRKNNILNAQIVVKNTNKNINKKLNSDKALESYKNDINEASKNINKNINTTIAGALAIKYKNRVTIYISGFDKNYSSYSPNYFLYYSLIEYYKRDYDYIDLNGITASLNKENKYYGLNKFKTGFKPNIYEYIGEFDLVLNENIYNFFVKTNLLSKEFNNY